MRALTLIMIAIVAAPNVFSAEQELDREQYDFYCSGLDLYEDECSKITKGDSLHNVHATVALHYCDTDYPILRSNRPSKQGADFHCIYNGKPPKYQIKLEKKQKQGLK